MIAFLDKLYFRFNGDTYKNGSSDIWSDNHSCRILKKVYQTAIYLPFFIPNAVEESKPHSLRGASTPLHFAQNDIVLVMIA